MMEMPNLPSRLMLESASFIRSAFAPESSSSTQISLQAFYDYARGLGYTQKEVSHTVQDLLGISFSTTLVENEASALPAPTAKNTGDNSQGSIRKIPVKPIPGPYKITEFADFPKPEVDGLPKFTISMDANDWNLRTCSFDTEKFSAEVRFEVEDNLWHLRWSHNSAVQSDLAFWLEASGEEPPVGKFKGKIAAQFARIPVSSTTIAIEGTLDMQVMSAGWSTGQIVGVSVCALILLVVFLVSLRLLMMRNNNVLVEQLNVVHPRRPGEQDLAARAQQITDANQSGAALQLGDNSGISLDDSRTPDDQFSRIRQAWEANVQSRIKRLSEALKKRPQNVCKPSDIEKTKKDDEEPRDPGSRDKDGHYDINSVDQIGQVPDSGAAHTIRTVVSSTEVLALESVFCDAVAASVVSAEEVFIEKMLPRAVNDLRQSFTQFDDYNQTIGPPTQFFLDWPKVADSAMKAAHTEMTAVTQSISLDQAQTIFLDKLQPFVVSALQGHLTPIYAATASTALGKIVLQFFGTDGFATFVINAAVRQAMCSTDVGGALASEVRRSAYTKSLQDHNVIRQDDLEKAAVATFQAQQEIEIAAQNAQERVENFLSSVEKLQQQGNENAQASIDKLAEQLQMQKVDDNTYILYQFKPFPTGEWALRTGRFGKENLGKAKPTGAVKVGGQLTLQEVRASQIQVAEGGSRVQIKIPRR